MGTLQGGTARMGKRGGLLDWYHQFVLCNAELIGNLESTLRSLCYIIPGMIKDRSIIFIDFRSI